MKEAEAKVVRFEEVNEEEVNVAEEQQPETKEKVGFGRKMLNLGNKVLDIRVRDMLVPFVVVGGAILISLYAIGKVCGNNNSDGENTEEQPFVDNDVTAEAPAVDFTEV